MQKADKLTVQGAIKITDQVVAEKEQEIRELRRVLDSQSQQVGDVAVGAAAFTQLLDNDELIRQEANRSSGCKKICASSSSRPKSIFRWSAPSWPASGRSWTRKSAVWKPIRPICPLAANPTAKKERSRVAQMAGAIGPGRWQGRIALGDLVASALAKKRPTRDSGAENKTAHHAVVAP